MGNFNPMAPEYTSNNNGGGGGYLKVAGDYLIACKSFKREQSNSKKSYLLCKFVAIAGPQKDKSFLERIYLNEEALWKMARFCQAIGHSETFNLDSDRDVREVIVNSPCKAKIKIKKQGDKEYTEIDFWYFEVTDKESAIMSEWAAEAATSVDGNDDSDYSGNGNRRSSNIADDDIPF